MSRITLINQTEELLRLAIFTRPVINPALGSIAWRVAEPPPGGQEGIDIPAGFEVFARCSADSHDPANPSCQTATMPFAETTARFSIDSVTSEDRMATGPVIAQRFDGLVMNEVRVSNNYRLGCEVSLCKDGDPIYAPQVVWPGALLTEDVRGSMYVAVVPQFTGKGQRLTQEEIEQSQTELPEGGVITVSGSSWMGYLLKVS